MTKASAPGKIILFGEHAVVYGQPALAVPVTQVGVEVNIVESARSGIWIDAPDVDLQAELNMLPSDHPIASVIHNFLFLSRVTPFPHLHIKITSSIPVASGLGSGAAVTVALTRALASHLHYPMAEEEVNAFAYEIEKLHHGTPSGIDNTVITYALPVYFVRGEPIETFQVGQPFLILIANTGIPAPTKESVGDVGRLWMEDKPRWETVFARIGEISFAARRAIEAGIPGLLGELMNENHALLQTLTVSSPELDRLVETALHAGALGAKMSGGGRGGNMITLVEAETADSVSVALEKAGAQGTILTRVS
ncbi:MAG TPA: mevalonate kinase [Anaerolineales bacterium]|jgi:mevalonate kinase|nr:mevalonate kinase [Anaerolineales bacterium]